MQSGERGFHAVPIVENVAVACSREFKGGNPTSNNVEGGLRLIRVENGREDRSEWRFRLVTDRPKEVKGE
jgi:hypothetical protein